MSEFIAERAKLIRQLADRADPFTKIRCYNSPRYMIEGLGCGKTCAPREVQHMQELAHLASVQACSDAAPQISVAASRRHCAR
jgi:hypothetical protein